MASRKSRYIAPRIAAATMPPILRLEQIAELLASPAKITPAELRVRVLAICEGCEEEPSDPAEWLDLAERAGVRHSQRYAAWRKVSAELTAGTRVTAIALPGPAARVRTKKAAAPDPAECPEVALYRWWDADDLLLYIGISGELGVRVSGHFKRSSWMDFAVRSTVERFPSRAEAERAEVAAIRAEHPLFNKQHNDTPEARQRLVEYLVERGRLDLLAPAPMRG